MSKKLWQIITITVLAFMLAACGGNGSNGSSADNSTDDSAAGTKESGAVMGGWQVNTDDTAGWTTDEAKAAFQKATQNLTDVSYQPVALLGTQVVAGTNYAFLCKEAEAADVPASKLDVAVVYEDLDGNAKITSVKDFNIGEYWNKESPKQPEGAVVGGWQQPDEFMSVNLPADVAAAYTEVLGDSTDYFPAAYLGSQIVAGTNYAVLCYTMEHSPCIVYIYQPLNDAPAELTNIYMMDIGSLVEAGQ